MCTQGNHQVVCFFAGYYTINSCILHNVAVQGANAVTWHAKSFNVCDISFLCCCWIAPCRTGLGSLNLNIWKSELVSFPSGVAEGFQSGETKVKKTEITTHTDVFKGWEGATINMWYLLFLFFQLRNHDIWWVVFQTYRSKVKNKTKVKECYCRHLHVNAPPRCVREHLKLQ